MPWKIENGRTVRVTSGHVSPPEVEVTREFTVPDGSVAVVLEWVGDDEARKAAALEAERNGKNRTTLIDALS